MARATRRQAGPCRASIPATICANSWRTVSVAPPRSSAHAASVTVHKPRRRSCDARPAVRVMRAETRKPQPRNRSALSGKSATARAHSTAQSFRSVAVTTRAPCTRERAPRRLLPKANPIRPRKRDTAPGPDCSRSRPNPPPARRPHNRDTCARYPAPYLFRQSTPAIHSIGSKERGALTIGRGPIPRPRNRCTEHQFSCRVPFLAFPRNRQPGAGPGYAGAGQTGYARRETTRPVPANARAARKLARQSCQAFSFACHASIIGYFGARLNPPSPTKSKKSQPARREGTGPRAYLFNRGNIIPREKSRMGI